MAVTVGVCVRVAVGWAGDDGYVTVLQLGQAQPAFRAGKLSLGDVDSAAAFQLAAEGQLEQNSIPAHARCRQLGRHQPETAGQVVALDHRQIREQVAKFPLAQAQQRGVILHLHVKGVQAHRAAHQKADFALPVHFHA